MCDYTNACIYKIVLNSIDDEDFYIGSTLNFGDRLIKHRTDALHKKTDNKLYTSIRNNDGKFRMCKLYDYPCDNGVELRIEERRAYDLYKPTLNTNKPYTSKEEKNHYQNQYRINNKEKTIENRKIYYQNNKERILKRDKEYRENNQDKINEYKEKSKPRKKEWYEENKERIAEQRKEYRKNNMEKVKKRNKEFNEKNKEQIAKQKTEYYEKNKERIRIKTKEYNDKNKEKRQEKITCDCGKIISRASLNSHRKSTQHIKLMEQQNSV